MWAQPDCTILWAMYIRTGKWMDRFVFSIIFIYIYTHYIYKYVFICLFMYIYIYIYKYLCIYVFFIPLLYNALNSSRAGNIDPKNCSEIIWSGGCWSKFHAQRRFISNFFSLGYHTLVHRRVLHLDWHGYVGRSHHATRTMPKVGIDGIEWGVIHKRQNPTMNRCRDRIRHDRNGL